VKPLKGGSTCSSSHSREPPEPEPAAKSINDNEFDVLKRLVSATGNVLWGTEITPSNKMKTSIIQQKVDDVWKLVPGQGAYLTHDFPSVIKTTRRDTKTPAKFANNAFKTIGQTFEDNDFRVTIWHKDMKFTQCQDLTGPLHKWRNGTC